ncbi:unnamed protein product [Rotaria magnacalcarata]|nr:unnamed protein product [Rotaria magnacalcarata]CAF5171067.1 unnamed protein product [Rotaria magnacalcarata]
MVPDPQIHILPVTTDCKLFKYHNLKPDINENYYKPHVSDGYQWTVVYFPTVLHPKSKDKEDVRILIEGCKQADKLCQTEPLKRKLRSLAQKMNENESTEDEDQFWESFVRKYALDFRHAISTRKIGIEKYLMTVVTPDIRAKGVRGLRVVDASIMPTLVFQQSIK